MADKPRRCLGCGVMFNSTSAANRFCKTCKKKRRKLEGSFTSLDTSSLPHTLMASISTRYYETPKASIVVHRADQLKEEHRERMRRARSVTPPWGPAYPVGI